MDLSKLPRLSQTPAPPGQSQDFANPAAPAYPAPPVSTGAEAWISIAVGIILLLMQQRLISWVLSKLGTTTFTWEFFDEQNNPITYVQSIYFGNDMGLAIFAISLVLDGIVMLWLRRPIVLMLALAITALATAWNLWTAVKLYGGYGLQIMPALAVAFGVYIAIYQWRLLQAARGGARVAP